jgi:hypothetical protein
LSTPFRKLFEFFFLDARRARTARARIVSRNDIYYKQKFIQLIKRFTKRTKEKRGLAPSLFSPLPVRELLVVLQFTIPPFARQPLRLQRRFDYRQACRLFLPPPTRFLPPLPVLPILGRAPLVIAKQTLFKKPPQN